MVIILHFSFLGKKKKRKTGKRRRKKNKIEKEREKNEPQKQLVIVMGDWQRDKMLKHNSPVPMIGLKRRLGKILKIYQLILLW